MSSPITPFKISIPDSTLSTLKNKLAASFFPEEIDFSDDWSYGTPLSDIKHLAQYWQNGFDWRAQEKILNDTMPQFTTKVNIDAFGELEMHFVHQKAREGSIPLLFCHGWPGSFLEVKKILPLLTKRENGVSFHVVAPSLPNFSFSEGVKKPGFGIPQYAEAMHKVMLALGYDKYVTQGGDWGFSITRMIGVKYPTHCLASHLNYGESRLAHLDEFLKTLNRPLTEEEEAGLQRTKWFSASGYGYNELQSTRPHTLSFALKDSPVALLSWIYEKLHDWTDSYPWSDAEILTWISIYYFSRAGPEASTRIYYEARNAAPQEERMRVYEYNETVKLGLSVFPRDLCVPPLEFTEGLGELVFRKRHGSGGHFAAYERAEALVGDLREMFGEGGGAEEVARGVKI